MGKRLAFCISAVLLMISANAVAWQAVTSGRSQAQANAPELTAEQERARFGKLMQQQAWHSPKVVNPNASAVANASLIGLLRKQQEVADAEKPQILAAEENRKSQQRGAQSHPTGPNTQLTPGRTESSSSSTGIKNATNSTASGTRTAEAFNPNAICPPGTQPVLRTVDGQKSGVVFTPETPTQMIPSSGYQYFVHTIEGCHFGDVAGHVALTGPFTKGRIDLAIDTWTDSGIVVHVPSDVTGELDQDNVTLALTISGMSLQVPGCKFYAARDEVLLSSMPQSEASLAGPHPRPNFPFYQSPGFGTFDVQRNTDASSFAPGTDYYSFDGLQRGFVPAGFQMSPYAPLTVDQCNYMINRSNMQIIFDGIWDAGWEGNRLRVNWRVSHCYAGQDSSASTPYNHWAAWYGVKIWAMGPRGVAPWPLMRAQPQVLQRK